MKRAKLYDEARLLRRLAQGDVSAFKEVYNSHNIYVNRAAFALLRSKEKAEDAVHDIFLAVWVNRANFARVESLRSYLVTMTRNLCLKHILKLKKEKDAEKAYAGDPKRAENATELDLNKKELEETVLKAIEKLPKQQRQVFRLTKLEGLSYEDVAERLQISPVTVSRHMNLASRSVSDYLRSLGLLLFLLMFAV